MSDNRRKFFRLIYPDSNCPTLLMNGKHFNILDISEEGLRFNPKNISGFQLENEVTGSITFPDGESFLVYGSVKRVQSDAISVNLKRPIPLRKIVEEQRRIIQKYPKTA